MHYKYKTQGTCSMLIEFDINGDIITNVVFHGGCPGNLAAISKVVDGKTVGQIEEWFKDIRCGNKPTSCTAQLAKAVKQAYESISA